MRVFGILVMLCASVRADAPVDPADATIATGQQLATQGRFKDAIVQFKLAHAASPTRPEPDCLIALAYRRLERWGQARLYLTRCMAFPTHPPWFAQLVMDIDDGLAHAGFTQVTFAVEPENAVIGISSFAPDEIFAPQPIFVEPGKALVTLSAPGFVSQQLAIDVPASGPFEVKAKLTPVAAPPPPPKPQPQPVPIATPEHSSAGKYVVFASAGVAVVGIGAHIAAALKRSDLTTSPEAYTNGIGTFHTERDVAIGAYAVAAVGLAVGGYLWHREVAPVVDAHGVGVAWSASW